MMSLCAGSAMLDRTQLGILSEVAANKVDLDEAGEWLKDKLVEIIMLDGPMLINVQGPSVFLTEAGRAALTTAKGGERGRS